KRAAREDQTPSWGGGEGGAGTSGVRVEGADGGSSTRWAARGWRHQCGTMASTPNAAPRPKASSTMMTWGARHSWPKNQRTTASWLLFNANANSVKKSRARRSQTRVRMTPDSGSGVCDGEMLVHRFAQGLAG